MLALFPYETAFDLRNALFLAHASKLAYSTPQRAREGAVKILGFETTRFISAEDTQLFISRNTDAIVIAFRGTQPGKIKDWMVDLDAKLKRLSIGQVHTGFYDALQTVWGHIQTTLKKYKDSNQKIWITGHSLGGALAMLAVSKFLSEEEEIGGLYTFGQPRVGDAEFAKSFDKVFKSRTFRFVNNNDIVCRVPPRTMGYTDAGQFRYFNIFGEVFGDEKTWRLFLDSLAGFAEKAAERFEELNQTALLYSLMDWVDDHNLDSYIANIEKNLKSGN